MAATAEPLQRGLIAPDFALPGVDGRTWTYEQAAGPRGLLVMFICNHCPYVLAVVDRIVRDAQALRDLGVGTVAISSNDAQAYPEDSFERMAGFARRHGFDFPYLYDESQQVALAYGAICTPDFFLFDARHQLAYRGQFDGSRPHTVHDVRAGRPRNVVPCDGVDMRNAADAVLAGRVPAEQRPSAGCSIKWKPENEPDWA